MEYHTKITGTNPCLDHLISIALFCLWLPNVQCYVPYVVSKCRQVDKLLSTACWQECRQLRRRPSSTLASCVLFTQEACCMWWRPTLQPDAMMHGGKKFEGRRHQRWTVHLPVEMTSCVGYVPFLALDPRMLFSQTKPMGWEKIVIIGQTRYDMTQNIVNKSNKNSIVTQMQLYCRHDKISFLLASIIPAWTAETIKGWNGRSSVDAAIRNFGFSSRSALVKHCMKMLLSKFPKHEILKINHPNWYLVIIKRVAVYIYIRTYISMIT
jgi:hypothetical protein